MSETLASCRRYLLICAALLVAAALVVAVGVIPPVRADTFPAALPDNAAKGFWASVVINLVVATALVFTARRTSGRSPFATTVLRILAFVAFLMSFALADAANAFRSHGPALHTATILLACCAAADFLTAVLIFTTTLVLPNQAGRA